MLFMSRHRRKAEPAPPVTLERWDPDSRETLEWRQAGRWASRWDLRSGEHVLATVQQSGRWSVAWTITYAHAAWHVRSRWTGALEASDGEGGVCVARYRPGFLNGRIERADQADLRVHSGGFWKPYLEVQTSDHLPLVRYRLQNSFARFDGLVEFEDAARRLPDLRLLVGLGWTAVLSEQRRGTATHVAAAAGLLPA